MLDFGIGELLLLAAIALIALGPKQLPEVARVVGRFIADMRRVVQEMTASFVAPVIEARDSTDRMLLRRHENPAANPEPQPEPEALDERAQLSFPALENADETRRN